MKKNKDDVILTLDAGTTNVRSLLVNQKGKILGISHQKLTQYYPESGWVEHDPIEIWNSQLTTIKNVKRKTGIRTANIKAIGIANQRETIVMWDKKSGTPCYNAIVWQDRRTTKYCEELVKQGFSKMVFDKTGLLINAYFSATKIKWILENVPMAQKLLKQDRLLFGTIETWLIWNLTNGKSHYTDISNASRTMLFNINTLDWDDELLKLFNIPKSILPKIKNTADDFGLMDPHLFSSASTDHVKICAAIGDQQAALFGQHCFHKNDLKVTYGTGCFLLMNCGSEPFFSKNKLLTSVGWKINDKTTYVLEGSVFIAGAALEWLNDQLRLMYRPDQGDYYANLVNLQEQKVYVVPSFTGIGAPYWNSESRGAIFGLERFTSREHIINATINSIAYQCNDLISTIEKDITTKIKLIKADGGVSESEYLMQFQADISNIKVFRASISETTALGATYMAGLQCKFFKSMADIKNINQPKKIFKPKISQQLRSKFLKGWNVAVSRTLNWTKDVE